MELTEKEFCKAYTAFYGEEITSIAQIQLNRSTGQEMFEFVEGLVKNLTLPVVGNSLVADIRNKLTPQLNLCAMIKNLPRPLTGDTDLNNLILKEVKQTEISIKYLSNL